MMSLSHPVGLSNPLYLRDRNREKSITRPQPLGTRGDLAPNPVSGVFSEPRPPLVKVCGGSFSWVCGHLVIPILQEN